MTGHMAAKYATIYSSGGGHSEELMRPSLEKFALSALIVSLLIVLLSAFMGTQGRWVGAFDGFLALVRPYWTWLLVVGATGLLLCCLLMRGNNNDS